MQNALLAPADNPAAALRLVYRKGAPPVVQSHAAPSGEPLWFSGRAYPVYEYGGPAQEQVDLTFTLPNGQDWEQLAAMAGSRKPVYLRDYLGNCVYGAITGLTDTCAGQSREVAVTLLRVDYQEQIPYASGEVR